MIYRRRGHRHLLTNTDACWFTITPSLVVIGLLEGGITSLMFCYMIWLWWYYPHMQGKDRPRWSVILSILILTGLMEVETKLLRLVTWLSSKDVSIICKVKLEHDGLPFSIYKMDMRPYKLLTWPSGNKSRRHLQHQGSVRWFTILPSLVIAGFIKGEIMPRND